MSGIAGVINADGSPVDRTLLRRMTDYMAARGPDARGVWAAGHVGLGHAMLRTTREAERERQPYGLDDALWIAADARIDGREELARRLEAEGCPGARRLPDASLPRPASVQRLQGRMPY